MNKREIHSPIQLLHTGISQQPESIRLASQVKDATNVDFTVEHGASKRPFTKFYHKLSPAATSGKDVRLHAIERDEHERYLVAYGDGNVRVFQEIGVQPPVMIEAVVTTSADASTYLASGSAVGANIIPTTVNDYTILVNNLVATGLITSPTYVVSETYDNYREMISHQPTNNSYVRTIGDDEYDMSGYFSYSSGSQTFGHINNIGNSLPNNWVTPAGNWDGSAYNPCGFRVGFQRVAMSLTNCTTVLVSGSTYTLTKVGAFTSYTFQSGDMIYITGGTGITAGWAIINSRDSNDQITIVGRGSCVLAAAANVSTDGIGAEYDVQENFDSTIGNQASSMKDIAKRLEDALHKVGCENGLISWNIESGGYFTVVSPYKGTDSAIKSILNPNYGGSTAIHNLTTAGHPFEWSAFVNKYNGTGGNPTTTQSPASRWTRTYASNDANARPDPTKMPVQLVRNYGPVYNKTISSSFTGSPTTVNCTNHGLSNGQTVVISGTGVAGLDATFVATVLNANAFTVPVGTFAPASTGTFYGKPGFTCSTIDWNYRTSGNDTDNPAPEPLLQGLTIADVAFVQNRMCLASGQYLFFSQTDDLFNFYMADYKNIVDSDPITAPLAVEQVVTCKYITPYRDAILVWTFNGEHIEFSWDVTLTLNSIRTTPTIKSQTWSTRPVRVGQYIYFNSERGSYAEIREYHYDDLSVQNVSNAVTTHVPTLVPLSVRTMTSVDAEGALLLLPDDSSKIYIYRWHYSGSTRDQSAWSKYQFDASYRITGMASIRNAVYLLIQTGSEYTIDCLIYEVPSDTF